MAAVKRIFTACLLALALGAGPLPLPTPGSGVLVPPLSPNPLQFQFTPGAAISSGQVNTNFNSIEGQIFAMLAGLNGCAFVPSAAVSAVVGVAPIAVTTTPCVTNSGAGEVVTVSLTGVIPIGSLPASPTFGGTVTAAGMIDTGTLQSGNLTTGPITSGAITATGNVVASGNITANAEIIGGIGVTAVPAGDVAMFTDGSNAILRSSVGSFFFQGATGAVTAVTVGQLASTGPVSGTAFTASSLNVSGTSVLTGTVFTNAISSNSTIYSGVSMTTSSVITNTENATGLVSAGGFLTNGTTTTNQLNAANIAATNQISSAGNVIGNPTNTTVGSTVYAVPGMMNISANNVGGTAKIVIGTCLFSNTSTCAITLSGNAKFNTEFECHAMLAAVAGQAGSIYAVPDTVGGTQNVTFTEVGATTINQSIVYTCIGF